MEHTLADYAPIVGMEAIQEIRFRAEKLEGIRLRHVNSTSVGGGVAEILNRLVPLMRETGIDASWEVIRGGEAFFEVTKAMHNALQGKSIELSEEMKRTYLAAQEENMRRIPLDGDVNFIHDPQPAGLLSPSTRGGAKWVWRCHIDLSNPNMQFWDFLRAYVSGYDAAVFSSPKFAKDTGTRSFIIPPSIDPLSDKNRELDAEQVRRVLEKHGIDPSRPVLTQVSRFDLFKDPFGVLEAYRRIRKEYDVQLVLAGGEATDDPEGASVLSRLCAEAVSDPDIHVLCLPATAHLEINALQRGSTIVLQKSIKEGFGLTVTEALWKGKPVIAGAVGGITLQVKHRITGILVNSVDGVVHYTKVLLNHPEFAETLGRNGREHVRQNFLLTRHLRDYLVLVVLARTGAGGIIPLDDAIGAIDAREAV